MPPLIVAPVPSTHAADAVTVLCAAFHDYPVMRYVVGPAADYDQRLRTLIDLFANGRFSRDEPALAVHDQTGRMLAVALLTPPGDRPAPPALLDHRERTWRALGADARGRYEAFVQACSRFPIELPHYHLNMIGVLPSHMGQGLGRLLLEAVQDLSRDDPQSAGVSLSTENPANIPLYEYFGYRVMGHARVAAELETWTFFRSDPPESRDSSPHLPSAGR